MQEEWRAVVGYEGFYEVSNLGRIKTVERQVPHKDGGTRTVRSRIRKHAYLKGYPAVNLSKQNKTKMRTIHVMVLEAFVGSRPTPLHDGCHGDGNQENNFLTNLRWGTKSENKQDSFAHGTAIFGERSGNAKITTDQAELIKSSSESAKELAKMFGVDRSTINRIRSGKTWSRALL